MGGTVAFGLVTGWLCAMLARHGCTFRGPLILVAIALVGGGWAVTEWANGMTTALGAGIFGGALLRCAFLGYVRRMVNIKHTEQASCRIHLPGEMPHLR